MSEKKYECACCAGTFTSWHDYDHSRWDTDGYGMCKSCQTIIIKVHDAEADEIVTKLRQVLSNENLATFNALTIEEQRKLAWQIKSEGKINYGFTQKLDDKDNELRVH